MSMLSPKEIEEIKSISKEEGTEVTFFTTEKSTGKEVEESFSVKDFLNKNCSINGFEPEFSQMSLIVDSKSDSSIQLEAENLESYFKLIKEVQQVLCS